MRKQQGVVIRKLHIGELEVDQLRILNTGLAQEQSAMINQNQEQIQRLLTQQETAICNKDVSAAMSQYAPSILSFDVVNSLQKEGLDACRERLEAWLSQFPGAISYDIENPVITAGEDIAYCHSINHVNGKTTTGSVINMRWRATVCYQKIDGQWQITHEHSSVPFDPESGKALIDLTL